MREGGGNTGSYRALLHKAWYWSSLGPVNILYVCASLYMHWLTRRSMCELSFHTLLNQGVSLQKEMQSDCGQTEHYVIGQLLIVYNSFQSKQVMS